MLDSTFVLYFTDGSRRRNRRIVMGGGVVVREKTWVRGTPVTVQVKNDRTTKVQQETEGS